MKKLVGFRSCLSTSIPSLGTEPVGSRSAAVAGNESYNLDESHGSGCRHAERPILRPSSDMALNLNWAGKEEINK
jgi:hypothetical protein